MPATWLTLLRIVALSTRSATSPTPVQGRGLFRRKEMYITLLHYEKGMYDDERWEFRGYSEFDSRGVPKFVELQRKETNEKALSERRDSAQDAHQDAHRT